MMPLFLTLETSLLAGVEHGERKKLRYLTALPPPRWMSSTSDIADATPSKDEARSRQSSTFGCDGT